MTGKPDSVGIGSAEELVRSGARQYITVTNLTGRNKNG